MQANLIESSPMPVKAVLAMMGRIENLWVADGPGASRHPIQTAKDRG